MIIPFPMNPNAMCLGGLVDLNGAPLVPRNPEMEELKAAVARFDRGFREVKLLPPASRTIIWPPGHRERMEALWAELDRTGQVDCTGEDKEELSRQLREFRALQPFLDPLEVPYATASYGGAR